MDKFSIPPEIIEECAKREYSVWSLGTKWEDTHEGTKELYRMSTKAVLDYFLEAVNESEV